MTCLGTPSLDPFTRKTFQAMSSASVRPSMSTSDVLELGELELELELAKNTPYNNTSRFALKLLVPSDKGYVLLHILSLDITPQRL